MTHTLLPNAVSTYEVASTSTAEAWGLAPRTPRPAMGHDPQLLLSTSHLLLDLPIRWFPKGFPTKILHSFPAHRNFLHFTIPTILGDFKEPVNGLIRPHDCIRLFNGRPGLLCGGGVPNSVQRLSYGLDDRGSFPGRGGDRIYSLRHRIQTDSGAHPASYPMGMLGLSPGSKAARVWSWRLNSF